MIDLSREELVPLRTLAKRRDGKMAVFIEVEQSSGYLGDRYRFCSYGTGGTWKVGPNGMNQSAPKNEDIISIARKWKPRNGERVSVLGFGEYEDKDGARNLTGKGPCIISDRDIESPSIMAQPDAILRVICTLEEDGQDEDVPFLVARCQLRRYIAPTSEEPSAESL